jgi:hypothetical protein
VANGWGDDLWPVRGVRLDAELVDEPARAHDWFEGGFEKGTVLCGPIDVGGDADEFALRVIFDVAAIALIDGTVRVEDREDEAARIDALRVPEDIGLRLLDEPCP